MVARKGHQSSTSTNTAARGHIKLTEKMKSFSLDCAEPPSAADHHHQGGSGGGVYPHHRMKPLRSARAFNTGHAASLDLCAERSTSPISTYFARRPPRRLPPVPDQQPQQQQQTAAAAVRQQPIQNSIAIPQILHIVTHEYIGGVACSLRPGERLVVVDNGDPDWKHGFKLDYCSEKLLTFPSSCIAAYKTAEEQPMRVTQTCNLVDQKMRLYRDQVVFVQPNSLAADGRVTTKMARHGVTTKVSGLTAGRLKIAG
uniref:SH3 domain-containing protein n=1 Tax=Globodera rostochiensis TaxID=31243 RepID=A0A914HQX9_GLORO